jgi:hypothetical protein
VPVAVKETILAALQKGDARDRGFRETVYRQVFAALERSVKTNAELSADDVFRRREQVVSIIAEIENDIAAQEAQNNWDLSAPSPADIRPGMRPSAADGYREPSADFVPTITRDERLTPGVRPAAESRPDMEALLHEDHDSHRERTRRRRNPLIRLIIWLIVLGLLAYGGLWLWGQAEEAVRTQGASIEDIIGSSGLSGTGELLPSREESEWIEIFTPSDASAVRANNGASAQISRNGEGEFLTIGGQGQAPISFDVGQGVLERFAGQTAIFSVSARAQEEETQITLTCDFGALGQCNRMRYVVGPTVAEYLFEVELANTSPSSGGTISIIPDIEGRGRMLDVFSVKVASE